MSTDAIVTMLLVLFITWGGFALSVAIALGRKSRTKRLDVTSHPPERTASLPPSQTQCRPDKP